MSISRVLVANRGEIAVRIVRACRKLGIETVVAVSDADRGSLAAVMADRSVCIGGPSPASSYLNIDALVTAAKGVGADAVHPGYGFLSENPKFAQACSRNGLIFIGPSAQNIRQMGDKLAARSIAEQCGVPTVPGSSQVGDLETAARAAESIGYPVLLKAAAGGGGRGIKVVRAADELKAMFESASAEARDAFGDERLYMERYVPNARHIEVQIVADANGRTLHLGERECSVQRRKQKLIEEAPCARLPAKLRAAICDAAVTLASHIRYLNVGTVEFLCDLGSERFYFLEMNTRVQVEHPVTEMTTGIDLVATGIRIAGGAPLEFSQEDVRFDGHAIECRINAEDPRAGFRPCPGRLGRWSIPALPGIRVDSHCHPGYLVAPYYDSLMAKVICWGADRAKALALMRYALSNLEVTGVETTAPFHLSVLEHADFVHGAVHTQWVENVFRPEGQTT